MLAKQLKEVMNELVVISINTDVVLLRLHFLTAKATDTQMVSRTARKLRSYPLQGIAKRLSKPVGTSKNNWLNFYVLMGCDADTSFGKVLFFK